MSTPEFDPADHPRAKTGEFTAKDHPESGGTDVLSNDLDSEKTFGELMEQEEQATRQLVHRAVKEIGSEFHRVTGKDLRYMDLAPSYDDNRPAYMRPLEGLTATDGTVYRGSEWEDRPSDSNKEDFNAVANATIDPASVMDESRLYFIQGAVVSEYGNEDDTIRVDVSKVG